MATSELGGLEGAVQVLVDEPETIYRGEGGSFLPVFVFATQRDVP